MICQRPHIMVDREERVRAMIEKVDLYCSYSVLFFFMDHAALLIRLLQQPGHLHLRDH